MSIKLLNKILLIVLVLLIINTLIPLKVDAISDMFSAADDFLSKGESPKDVIDEGKLISTSSTIYKWLMIIAICVAVIIGAILGVQFITGSIEGKAKIQEAFAPYIIGCLIVFGSFFIWKTLVNVGNDLEGDTMDAATRTGLTTIKIDEGTVDVSELSDDELRALWSHNHIDTEIANKIKRFSK